MDKDLYTRLADFYNQYLGDNMCVKNAILLGREQPKLREELFLELDEAVEMFNMYLENKLVSEIAPEILINANTLKTILAGKMKLPVSRVLFEDLLSDGKLKTAFMDKFRNFEFLVEIGNTAKLLACILVVSYRTYMLVKYPFLQEKNVQVASTLEEMFAMMAINGEEKHLFRATKHWIMDWKNEGFSEELSDKVAKL